ncbi:hypothetical protein GCM10009670_26410 [Citricoccus alkalitolerans]
MCEDGIIPPAHPEAAEADMVEQELPVQPDSEDEAVVDRKPPVEANDADVVEQLTVYPLDEEDEYPHDA